MCTGDFQFHTELHCDGLQTYRKRFKRRQTFSLGNTEREKSQPAHVRQPAPRSSNIHEKQ